MRHDFREGALPGRRVEVVRQEGCEPLERCGRVRANQRTRWPNQQTFSRVNSKGPWTANSSSSSSRCSCLICSGGIHGTTSVTWAGTPALAEGSWTDRHAPTRASASGTGTSSALCAQLVVVPTRPWPPVRRCAPTTIPKLTALGAAVAITTHRGHHPHTAQAGPAGGRHARVWPPAAVSPLSPGFGVRCRRHGGAGKRSGVGQERSGGGGGALSTPAPKTVASSTGTATSSCS